MGRPPLDAHGSKQIAVRIPVQLEKQVQDELRLGESMSELIRMAIVMEVQRRRLKGRDDSA